MISVQEALTIVQNTATVSASIHLPIQEVVGHVLAKEVVSSINFPPFNQSAMDGYVISEQHSREYVVKGVIQAGQDATNIRIGKGEAYRIFTGGMVPASAWAVVRQEDAIVIENAVSFIALPQEMANIRLEGESVRKGEIVLQKDTLLTPAGIGLLVSLGVEGVSVYAKPKIAVVSTGDELLPLGSELVKGKIYESNAHMLVNALRLAGCDAVTSFYIQDNRERTFEVLSEVIDTHDFVLISGGVSVGDYDFVAEALLKIGIQQQFHKVKQKPGKPFFYGTFNEKKVFGLPGNPAAALTLFYIYVLPSLQYSMGKGGSSPKVGE
jgi:molybdopterin molybdotransferase